MDTYLTCSVFTYFVLAYFYFFKFFNIDRYILIIYKR